jgi:hypothetical protein
VTLSMKFAVITIFLLTFLFPATANAQVYLPKYWEKCVVMIEKEWQDTNGTIDTVGHGTGFLFADSVLGGFLITNRHILRGRPLIFIRYNRADFDPEKDKVRYYREPCPLTDNDAQPLWKGHPNPKVDVAAVRIRLPPDVQVDVRDVQYSRFKSFDSLEVGEDVYFFGFPLGIVGWKGIGDFPILRSGIVSYKSIELTRIGDAIIDSTMFLIDGFSFAGNSGSPVLTRATPPIYKAKLIGIIRGHVPNVEQYVIGVDTIAFEQNTGLAIAECADKIRETLEQFRTK